MLKLNRLNNLGVLFLASLFIVMSSCTVVKDNTLRSPTLNDSLMISIPQEYYNPYIGFPIPKLNLESQTLYLMAGGNKSIIQYDLKKDKIHRIVGCERVQNLQYVFNFIPLADNSFMVFFGPDQGAYHDNFVGFVTDSSVYFPEYNYDGTNILVTAYYDSIDFNNSTFLNPFFLDPILGEDSSLIFPCHYGSRVPGTEGYNRLDQGKFVKVYPKTAKKAAHFLSPRVSDVIPSEKIFEVNYPKINGWMEGNKLVWGYSFNNDLHTYDLKRDKLSTVHQKSPFFPEIQSIDTTEDRYHDYSQNEFIYLIRNPYKREVYRVVEKPRRAGFYVIVMDEEFNELSVYEMPNNVTYPFLCSKEGLYVHIMDSYNRKGSYQFNEFVFE